MKFSKSILPVLLSASFSICSFSAAYAVNENVPDGTKLSQSMRFSGPFVHENLTVFLIHGKDSSTGQAPLTLEEALAQKKVVIKETGDVNELNIQNLGTMPVFIQGGDIVKGGQQDRALQSDMLLPGTQANFR